MFTGIAPHRGVKVLWEKPVDRWPTAPDGALTSAGPTWPMATRITTCYIVISTDSHPNDGDDGDLAMPKIVLTRAALIARINRRLAKDNERLKVARRDQKAVGYYFTVNEEGVTRRDVDLEALAKKLDVIKGWEELAAD
jgi:hypothetical protein